MRYVLATGLLVGIAVAALFHDPAPVRGESALAASWPAEDGAPPTVVELFTSQGCSSCPPADALLAELAGRRDVVAIAYHVTYWDYLGWKDPFATAWGTGRQRAYVRALGLRGPYTPQMVVDGGTDVVGSRRRAVAAALADSRASAAARVRAGLSRDPATGDLLVSLPGHPLDRAAEILLVRYAGPRKTEVLRGENGGRVLENTRIARELRRLGAWTGEPRQLRVPADPDAAGGYALILQEPGQGRILGAAQLAPPDP